MYGELLFGDMKKRKQLKDNNMKVGVKQTDLESLD
jgi:hypothetical protein